MRVLWNVASVLISYDGSYQVGGYNSIVIECYILLITMLFYQHFIHVSVLSQYAMDGFAVTCIPYAKPQTVSRPFEINLLIFEDKSK